MADLFSLIADPDMRTTLREVLDATGDGETMTVSELARRLGVPDDAALARVTTLEDAGLLRIGGTDEEHTVRLDATPLYEIDAWLSPFIDTAAVRREREEDADDAGSAVFAAWAGVQLPPSLQKARENLQLARENIQQARESMQQARESLQRPGDAGSAVGRALADTQAKASEVLHEASAAAKKLKEKLRHTDQ